LLIIASIAIIGGVFAFQEYENSKTSKTYALEDNSVSATASFIAENIISQDTDGDGLMDWEDTDGDGTSDKDEIEKKRNPLKKGNDAITLSETKKISDTKFGTSTENITLSDQLGRDLFSRYMSMKQSGQSGDIRNQELLVKELLENKDYSIKIKTYSPSDIKSRKDTSNESVRKYGNELGKIFKTYMIESQNEGVIVRDSIVSQNPALLDKLIPIIASYKNILNESLKIEVPENAVYIHLNIVNNLNSLIYSVESMSKIYADPIVALLGLTAYQTYGENFFLSIKEMGAFLNSRVTFTTEETGSIFN
jgi:hypothetical protein